MWTAPARSFGELYCTNPLGMWRKLTDDVPCSALTLLVVGNTIRSAACKTIEVSNLDVLQQSPPPGGMDFPASMLVATSCSHSDVTDDRVRGCVAGFWTHIL
jgi:hypothetical protein